MKYEAQIAELNFKLDKIKGEYNPLVKEIDDIKHECKANKKLKIKLERDQAEINVK